MKLKHLFFIFTIVSLLFCSYQIFGAFSSHISSKSEFNGYPQDNYADEIVTSLSHYYMDGENALGAPDNECAKIFSDYANGVIVLDLGRYEICVDDIGNDLRVHINNGTYIIKINNDLSTAFTSLGQANETEEFDIDSVGFTEVRYVQIQYVSGGFVELDAIEVINLYTVVTDNNKPSITGPDDFWIYENETEISIYWKLSDATPWNYSIFINTNLLESGEWFGDSLDLHLYDISVGILNISLILFDYFGNSNSDTVSIEIRALPEKTNFFIMFLPLLLIPLVKRTKTRKLKS